VVAAVVPIVTTTVGVVVLLTVTELEARLQEAGSLAAVGLMAQLRLTVPLYPPAEVRVTVVVFPVIAPAVTVTLPALVMLNEGATAELTVTFTVAVCVIDPEVPVTVTV